MHTSSSDTLHALAALQHAPGSVTVGTLARARPGEAPHVTWPGADSWEPRPAASTVVLSPEAEGASVVLVLPPGDALPVILGVLQSDPVRPAATAEAHLEGTPHVAVDGEQVAIEAREQLVLRCGKSSLILRADGHVTLKGVKVVSRASRTNKVRGGNVLIN